MSVFKLFTTIWGLPEFQMKHGDVFDIGTYQKAAELLTSQSNLASNFFFVSNDTGKFVSSHSCRELFNGYIENYLTKDSRKPILIGFCYNGLDMEKVFAFFSTIEHKLGERARINIYPTKYKNCVVFAPSAFWFKNWYRHMMLTLFIRCGVVYFKGDFQESLKSYSLTNLVLPVVQLFLDGFVDETHNLVSNDYGIIAVYSKKSVSDLPSLFKKTT